MTRPAAGNSSQDTAKCCVLAVLLMVDKNNTTFQNSMNSILVPAGGKCF